MLLARSLADETRRGFGRAGAAAVPGGPGPEGDSLSGRLDHEGARKDRVVREVLGIHPMLAPQLDLGPVQGPSKAVTRVIWRICPPGKNVPSSLAGIWNVRVGKVNRVTSLLGRRGSHCGRWVPLSEMSVTGANFGT